MTREELFDAVGCEYYSSYHNYDNLIEGYTLQFYNREKKKYIYNYSIIYRTESEFPMYGIFSNGFYADSLVYEIHNVNELRKFGRYALNQDNSIFNKKFDIERTDITDDKMLNSLVRKDKSILNLVYGTYHTFILRVK